MAKIRLLLSAINDDRGVVAFGKVVVFIFFFKKSTYAHTYTQTPRKKPLRYCTQQHRQSESEIRKTKNCGMLEYSGNIKNIEVSFTLAKKMYSTQL